MNFQFGRHEHRISTPNSEEPRKVANGPCQAMSTRMAEIMVNPHPHEVMTGSCVHQVQEVDGAYLRGLPCPCIPIPTVAVTCCSGFVCGLFRKLSICARKSLAEGQSGPFSRTRRSSIS